MLGVFVSAFMVIGFWFGRPFVKKYIYEGVDDDKGVLDIVTKNVDVGVTKSLDSSIIESLINKYRSENSKPKVRHYNQLCDLAKIRVYEVSSDWSHEGFKKRSEEDTLYLKYCNSSDYVCTGVAENLAKGSVVEIDILGGWKNSKLHNDTLLGDYDAQCVAVNGEVVVSLFAKTISIDSISGQDPSKVSIAYDYEKVIFWEERIKEDRKSIERWNGARNNEYYDEDKVNKLHGLLDRLVVIAEDLWDGFTNTSLSIQKTNDLEAEYWEKTKSSVDLMLKLDEQGRLGIYKKCVDTIKELEEEYGEDLSEDLKECNKYLNSNEQ